MTSKLAKVRQADIHGMATSVSERYRVTSDRLVQWGGAPCGGFLQLLRDEEKDGSRRVADIPWDSSWEPGSVVNVEVKVTLIKAAAKSRKRCHNPWPAHVCDDGKRRKPSERNGKGARRGGRK